MTDESSPEERALFTAQAETERHKAREAEMRALTASLQFERAREEHLWQRATNPFHRVYVFDDPVTEATVGACSGQLDIWERIMPGQDITLRLYSPGGDLLAGMYLFDRLRALRSAGHKVTVEAFGYAASMAGILLQAGDVRRIGREAYVLIHEVAFGARGKIGEIEDEVEFVRKIQDRVLDIFAENAKRAGEAGTATAPLTRREFKRRWLRKDWWLSSEEALRFGIVDEVI